MVRYVLQRLGQTLLVLLIVSLLTYLLVDFLPGDPIAAMTGGEISGETYERLYYEMNMDKPVIVRYALWLRDALTGNLGTSASYHRKVVDIIGERVPVTIYLSLLAFLISVPLGILFGIISAVRRRKRGGYRGDPDRQHRQLPAAVLAGNPLHVHLLHAAGLAALQRLCLAP